MARDREKMVEIMLQNVNAKRERHGLRALKPAPALLRSSRRFSQRLMKHDFFAHSGLPRAGRLRIRGETLEMHSGRNPRPRLALRLLLQSAAHTAILLDPSMRYLGAGFTSGRFRGSPAVIWVLQAAR